MKLSRAVDMHESFETDFYLGSSTFPKSRPEIPQLAIARLRSSYKVIEFSHISRFSINLKLRSIFSSASTHTSNHELRYGMPGLLTLLLKLIHSHPDAEVYHSIHGGDIIYAALHFFFFTTIFSALASFVAFFFCHANQRSPDLYGLTFTPARSAARPIEVFDSRY